MRNDTAFFEAMKIIGLCVMWYSSSASGNIVGKMLLTDFPYPMTVTMVQLISITVYLTPLLRLKAATTSSGHSVSIPRNYYFKVIIPLAMGKFLASVSSHVSIWKVSVSYAHTVKATLPLFTVILSRILLGVKQTMCIYISLLPIIGGVIIATMTELSFDIIGLFSALLSTMGFSLMTIFSKKCLIDTGIHHMRLLVMLARWSALCFFPVWFTYDLFRIIRNIDFITSNMKLTTIVSLLLLDGFFNTLQNLIAFTVMALISPLSYAVANAMKRIVIIGASIMMLRNPVTPINCFGMFISILGVFSYNKAKYEQNKAFDKELVLPKIQPESNLLLQVYNTADNNDVRLHNGMVAGGNLLHNKGSVAYQAAQQTWQTASKLKFQEISSSSSSSSLLLSENKQRDSRNYYHV
ncbi:solute carrier family 35 member E1 homolog [Argonauta hians]